MRGHFGHKRYVDKTGKLRKTSTWSVWYELPRQRGEHRKQKVRSGFSTRKDAIAWFTRKAEELRQGIAPADDRQTVEQYLRQWLEAIADSVSGSALHAYSNHVEAHIIPRWEDPRDRTAPAAHREGEGAMGYRASRSTEEEGASIVTDRSPCLLDLANGALSLEATAPDRGESLRACRSSAGRTARDARARRRECRKAPGRVRSKRHRRRDHNSLGTGLRRGELLALRRGDVDLERASLTVQRAIERVDRSSRFARIRRRNARAGRSVSRALWSTGSDVIAPSERNGFGPRGWDT